MKNYFMLAATVAIALSSCSKNDVSEIATPNENPNAIGLNIGAFATKSAATDILALQGTGVTLYSTDATFGTLSFTYAVDKWTNDDSKNWVGVDFPMSVYSAHDGANVALTAGAAISNYDATAGEKDLVYFGQTLSTIPSGAQISAIYKHALSRVKMEETTTSTMTTDVIDVELMGFDGEASAAITPATNTIAWSDNTAADVNYAYDLENALTATNHMYVIPKTTEAFVENPSTEKLDTPYTNKSGVTALCITSVGDTPVVGSASVAAFKKANPNVEKVIIKGSNPEVLYDGKMYVKAIFPINNVEFKDGVYYNLQLNFAGSTVYYFDSSYYTEDGKEIEVVGPTNTPDPDGGKPINPSDTDLIGLSVVVNPWPAATPQAL